MGGDLRGTGGGGIAPISYLGGGVDGAFIPPPSIENVIANCHSAEIEKTRNRRYDTSDRHTSLFYRAID